MTTIEQARQKLIAVLCDPEGRACITGSAGDLREIDEALAMIAAHEAQYALVGEIIREGVVGVSFSASCDYGCGLPNGTKLYTRKETP